MKKVFLTLMMLLFAVTGVMRAQTLTVHDGTTTNGFVPVYGFYADAYNKCEMVYPSTELGEMAGGMINSMTFYAQQSSVSWGANFQVFLAEVENATISAFAGPGTVVYEGSLSISGGEMVVTFDTPYAYAGGNLLVGVYETSTGSYITSNWYGESVTGASGSGYSYSSLADCSFIQRNFLPKTTFEYISGGGGALTTTPDVLDLGYRPNGAWMAPYVFEINSTGMANVTALDFSGSYFTANAELPATVYAGNPLEVTLTTGTAEVGEVNGTMTVLFGSKDAQQFPVTAYAYDPVEGDVWETAINVTSFPYSGQAPAPIYKNYDLPTATTGADAVYKVTFDEDVLFSAGTPGDNAAAAIYTEDFNGAEGPMADNNYEYVIPSNEIPVVYTYAFESDLEGWTNLIVNTSGGEWLHSNDNLGGYDYTALAHGGSGFAMCYSFVDNVGSLNTDAYLVSPQKYSIDANSTLSFWADNANDSYPEYFSVCVSTAANPTAADFTEIWTGSAKGTANGGEKVRHQNNRYQNWRSHEISLAAYAGQEIWIAFHDVNYDQYEIWIDDVTIACIGTRGNRDVQTLIEEGFEGGIGDWTLNHCHNNTGVTSAYTANTGSYVFRFYYTTAYPQYLISPELSDNNGGIFSFYAAGYDTDYIETFQLGYSTTTNDPSAFTWGSELSLQNEYEYAQYSSVFPAGTKYVAIACTSDDQFYLFIDDILVTAEGGGTPEPPTPTATYQIADMFVPAGTYYVVVASTTDNFQVDMAVADAPLPEPAIAVSPADGAVNVASPVTLSWQLGAYTTEYQVLFGTQYPPVNVLVDWTDELATSALAGELVNNQSYFWQVNERNASGTTNSEIFAFTSTIDPVEGFAVENDSLYPGDAAVFTWEANRSLKGYNLYMDGVKVNETLITTNEYAVEGLEYNMLGYDFQVAAVYDAGESVWSDPITVYMTGYGTISGHVYDAPDYDPEDPDQSHPVANLPVFILVQDEYGQMQEYEAFTNEEGLYTAEVLAGIAIPGISLETAQAYGYAVAAYSGAFVMVAYQGDYPNIDLYTHEYYYPLEQITATEEENDVLVEWSWTPAEMIVDFETGDFSQADFTLPTTYPWEICANAHEGSYAMKSTCEGVNSASSTIELTVDVPYDGKMGFYVSVSSESNYDKFHFYIDGVEKGTALSGTVAYTYKEYDVTEGTHTYKWEYAKDSSVNSGDDCAYVDDITLYRYEAPLPPIVGATEYNFDDNTMMGWTSIDADNDGNGWVSSANPGIYHNSGVSLSGTGHNASEAYVISGSYANQTGAALTPDNYLVTPAAISAENGAQIRFYACAQDASYAAEHFGVAVSTTTATASAFTTIQEWTMTAKGNGVLSEGRGRQTRQGEWYEYTVDLSSYAGQDIWVAIRHFNCTDQFILNVDDITVATGGSKNDRGNRSFMSYNLYRRNNYDEASVANPELIAEGLPADVMQYVDNAWNTISFGEYQWGIQATYAGYAPVPERVAKIDENAEYVGFNTAVPANNGNRAMWDYVTSFSGTSAGQQGVATDGQYIYTVSWQPAPTGGHTFYQYDLQGNFIEGFEIAGATQIRDLTSDGEYFYGTSGGTQIYCMDFNTRTLVGTITCSGLTSRHISYDPERDGFWSGNWSTLALYSRTGALVQSGPAPTSAYGSAYYKDDDNVEHLFLFCQPNSDAKVYDYNITTNTLGTSPVFDFASTPGFDGIAGGCFIGTYDNKTCWFGNSQQDPNLIGIYELNASSGPVPPVPPTPGETGDGLSEILWSNVIEKDMEATLTFTITLNNGQSPVGALIEIVGEETYTEEAEGATTEIVVRKAHNYDMTVTLPGYTSWSHSGAVEADETFNITLNEQILPVDGLYVSPTGWAKWDGGGVTPGPGPGPQPGGSSFTEGFEGGMPEGWNVIDGNNDGWTWCLTSAIPSTWTYYASMSLDWYRTGTNAICSGSYINGVGALTPNEYLVMGQQSITAGSTLSFYAAATDASYPADHFGVFVSDDAANWTSVQEWTLTGKGTRNGGRESRDGNGAKLGTWYQFTANLDAYAGTTKYIAIRHFNCNDQYIMCVDDIELSVVNKGDEDAPIKYIVKLDGVVDGETTFTGFQHHVAGMEEGSVHTTAVRPVYINGNGDWMEYTWTYTACDHFAGVEDLAAAQQGDDVKLTWTMPGAPGPGPQPGAGWSEGFENGMPEGWTVVDDNNDGYTWCLTSAIPSTWTYYASLTLDWYRTGTNAICSGSYINGAGALTPDEYLVMGQQAIGAGSTLSFWAAATDASYPADHFGVFVSDDASTWTSVQEWTLTAKSGAANGGRESRDAKGAKLGTWYNYTVDLSAFAGNKYIAIRHFNCTDQYIMCVDDIEFGVANKANDRDAWDLVSYFSGTSAGQQAVATDGEFIYTASWQATPTGGYTFYKYDLEGNFVEGFDIAGATGIRDLTTDGQYFYGTSGGAQIFCLDLANKTLVSTITCSGLTSRHISYDPVRDGFWSGNWTTLALYSRTGALLQNGPATTSAYGSAYYEDANGEEHLYLFCQPNSDAKVYDYNITTGSLGSSPVFDFAATPGFNGIAGGCFIGNYGDKLCWFGNSQQDPNLIGIYELEAGVVPPTPVEGILGAMIFMDGEPIAFVEGNPTQYVVEGAAYVDATYGVRVVYGGEYDVTYYAMSCMDEVDYVAPPTAVDEISSNTVIYPNPAHDNVTIEAKGMRRITVVSALGQVVYDAEIEADMTQLNLGQFKAGLYMVRIATENGTVVKRVTVVK